MAQTLRDFRPHLRRYTGMYVPQLSYMATCAFIDGYVLASDEQLIDFHQWLVARGTTRPELGWPWLVLAKTYPADELPDTRKFTDEQDRQARELLFDLLAAYYASLASA